MFDDTEERQARRVVVLGQTVVENLFPNMDPVGQTMRINGGTYEVIGVLTVKGPDRLRRTRTTSCWRRSRP